MKNNTALLLIAAVALAFDCNSCNKKPQEASITISPEAGTSYKQGQDVAVKLSYPADMKPDSIVYLLDSTRFASKKDSSAAALKTDSISLGPRVITAKVLSQASYQPDNLI